MVILVRFLPIIIIIALVILAVKFISNYAKNVAPVKKAERQEAEQSLKGFHDATHEYQWINRNWLDLIENNPAKEIDIPSSTNLKIEEVSNFIRAKHEFANSWDDKLLTKAKFNDAEKVKFSKNVQELKSYYRGYIGKIIELDNPSKEFQLKAMPSDKRFLS